MKISILGGGGFLGRKIAAKLAKDGTLGGKPITALTLFDMTEPPKPEAPFPVTSVGGDVVNLPDTAIPPEPTSSSTSPPWSAPRPRPTTISAAGSIFAAPTP